MFLDQLGNVPRLRDDLHIIAGTIFPFLIGAAIQVHLRPARWNRGSLGREGDGNLEAPDKESRAPALMFPVPGN